jgi:hypothetical protein
LLCGKAANLGGLKKGASDAFFKADEVVFGVLACKVMILRIQKDSLRSGRVWGDGGAELFSVRATDD